MSNDLQELTPAHRRIAHDELIISLAVALLESKTDSKLMRGKEFLALKAGLSKSRAQMLENYGDGFTIISFTKEVFNLLAKRLLETTDDATLSQVVEYIYSLNLGEVFKVNSQEALEKLKNGDL